MPGPSRAHDYVAVNEIARRMVTDESGHARQGVRFVKGVVGAQEKQPLPVAMPTPRFIASYGPWSDPLWMTNRVSRKGPKPFAMSSVPSVEPPSTKITSKSLQVW